VEETKDDFEVLCENLCCWVTEEFYYQCIFDVPEFIRNCISGIYEFEIEELKNKIARLEKDKEGAPAVWDISCSFDSGIEEGKIEQTKRIKDDIELRYNTLLANLDKASKWQEKL
jgi:hypothetical protein